MSHMTKVEVQMSNVKAIATAAKNLGIKTEQVTNMKFYRDGDRATGTAVYLSGWRYPMVIEDSGEIKMDNYGGSWGKQDKLDEFKREYSLEALKAKLTAKRKKFTVKKLNNRYEINIPV